MSNFDIEQCKRDGGLAIHEQLGEVKIIVFEKDSDGHLVAQRFKNKTYYFTSEGFLANIPKKKKVTIYVYKDFNGGFFVTNSGRPSHEHKLIDTIEKEYEI
jgi:hypothetical protein